MKKENVFGIVMYLVIFALAVVYGLTVLQTHFKYSAMTAVWQYAVYIIGCIVGGILISAILAEFGHFLGAKVGGYKIIKFTILYFSIYLDKEKRKFGFRKFDGLTGETLIIPNYEKKEKPNPYPYLWYGPFFLLSWFAACLVCFFSFNSGGKIEGDIAYGFLTVGLISLILFVYDIVPIKTDTTTDGYQIAQLLKTKDVKGYNDLLLAKNDPENALAISTEKGKKKEAPQVVVNNSVEGKILSVLNHIDNKEYDDANALIEELFSKKEELTSKNYLEVEESRIYIKIMTTPYEEMAEYYENELPLSTKRDISADRSLAGIRTYILMAGLFDKSRSECVLVLSKVAKAYKNTIPSRKHAELVLFNDALEKVCSAHPKWELDIYKLYE